MYPLIEIKTVPIEIQMKVNHAKVEYSRGSAELEISRDTGGLNVRSKPIRLKLDTFEARNSLVPTTMRKVEQSAEAGKQAAYQATATYAQQGQLLLKAQIGQEMVTQFAKDAQRVSTDVGIQFLPQGGAEISWDPQEMSIKYEMDKLSFDWHLGNGDFKFTPGNIEIKMTQRPDVIIKYVGGPVYVPPSADPSYKPIDVEA